MSKREIELFIFDIYIAILKIEYVAKDYEDAQKMLHDFKSWDTIIREFEIIGEASNHLLKNELLDKRYQIVVDFRNLIIHEYFGIEPDEVYDIINSELVSFKEVIYNLIKNLDSELRIELKNGYIKDNEYLDFIVLKLKEIK